jgi:hypothetical protein
VSGLLSRLAGQAMGSRAHGAPSRIRAAMSVHAQAPLGTGETDSHGAEPGLEMSPSAAHASTLPESPAPADEDLAVEAPPTRFVTLESTRHRDANTNVVPRMRSAQRVAAPARDTVTPAPRAGSPAPLLPEAPPPAQTLASVPQPARESRDLTSPKFAAADVPTEVHVHIGRIDVIAAPEHDVPKKPRAPASHPTLPLADYLARRKRS